MLILKSELHLGNMQICANFLPSLVTRLNDHLPYKELMAAISKWLKWFNPLTNLTKIYVQRTYVSNFIKTNPVVWSLQQSQTHTNKKVCHDLRSRILLTLIQLLKRKEKEIGFGMMEFYWFENSRLSHYK